MFMGATAVTRAMKAAFDLAEVTVKALETVSAAGVVIGARAGVIAAAQQDPLNADHAELGRMLPEKVTAFSQAGAAIAEEWWALQRDVGNYMLYLGRSMTRVGLPLPGDVIEFAERTSAHGARIAASPIGSASVALAPLHKTATANARRLAGGKRRA
jgi:hypothetical protein